MYQKINAANIIVKYVKLATVVEGDQKAPFLIGTPFLGLLHFTLDTYIILPEC